MDKLIDELVKCFEKEKDKKYSKGNHEVKIVAKADKNGDMEVLGISGNENSILAVLCVIFKEIAKHSKLSAKELAMMCSMTLEIREGLDD